MATITNYSDLKSKLLAYLGIPASHSRADEVDLFIQLAEKRFDLELRTRDMMATAAVVLDANGVGPLPADYVGFRRATIPNGNETIDLVEHTPEQLLDQYARASAGIPRAIALEGDSVTVRPISDQNVTLYYYRSIPPLTDASPTNWLLTKSPGIYVSAAMAEAAFRYFDVERGQQWEAVYQRDRALLGKADRSERTTHGPIRVKGPTP